MTYCAHPDWPLPQKPEPWSMLTLCEHASTCPRCGYTVGDNPCACELEMLDHALPLLRRMTK